MISRDFKEISILCENSEEAFRIAAQIHDQLVGNENYISSKILLNYDGRKSEVYMMVDPEIDIPNITLNLSKPKD